ncbi:MAG: OmpA family protein [Gammaproteobacteria bacterium]|nr:OmpA family protein [Gammaproteobacteria bacterium]
MNTTLYRLLISSLFLLLGLLVGCTSMDPYSGQPKTSQTTKGAGIGAASGAALGALLGGKGDRTEGALIGAGVGALIGGAVGHTMDMQEADLRRKLEVASVQVNRQGDLFVLNLPRHIQFDKNSTALKEDFREKLNAIAEAIKGLQKSNVLITGYASGDEDNPQRLSERRAETVSAYLFGRGVPDFRIRTLGQGASSQDQESRRVEVTISPVSA